MNRAVSRRIERLEARTAPTRPTLISSRVLLVHPVHGLTGVFVLDPNGSRQELGTSEEKESVRASLEKHRALRK